MKRIIYILFVLIGTFAYSQDLDYMQLCQDCVTEGGFYCGDDPANWTQYSPNGCVIAGWLNDGWEDCVDASDENGAEPTSIEDCAPPPPPPCDTVYVDVPIIEIDTVFVDVPFYIYETEYVFDTIVQTEYFTIFDTIVQFDYIYEEVFIYETDTLWMEGALDTMFINTIEYVEVPIFDTINVIETEYIFVTDTVTEYVEIINTEYLDCDTGLPCNSSIGEIIEKSKTDPRIYNINGQAIRKPEGLYIQNGQVKYKF